MDVPISFVKSDLPFKDAELLLEVMDSLVFPPSASLSSTIEDRL